MKKITIQHLVTTRFADGTIDYVQGRLTEESLEDLRKIMIDAADYFIDGLLESTKGHIITHGFIVHPLIHIIHDDETLDNPTYQEFLKKEKRIERKQKLEKISIL